MVADKATRRAFDPKRRVAAEFASDDAQVRGVVEQNLDLVQHLAALSELGVAAGRLDAAASSVRATAVFDVSGERRTLKPHSGEDDA